MTANMFLQRVEDAAARSNKLTTRLLMAAGAAGKYSDREICDALNWVAVQLDPEADDYETWETTLLARLENPNSGER